MTDNTPEQFDPVGPEIPGGEVHMEGADPAPPPPKPAMMFTFEAGGSSHFHYQRTEGITPYQMLAVAGHLEVEAKLMIESWVIQKQMEGRAQQPQVMVAPPMPRRGLRSILDKGKWKPPANRN